MSLVKQEHRPSLHRTLLRNLSDGVIVIDFDGFVRTANTAFCRMFGLAPEEVEGRLFADLFIAFEEFDEFAQTILDVVMERGTGKRQIVRVRIGEALRTLSIVTSYLTASDAEETKQEAVIAVISDITEIQELHEADLRMKQVIESQLDELQSAYRDLESRNEALDQLARKVQTARTLAVSFVLVLFVAFGAWYIQPLDIVDSAPLPPEPTPGLINGGPEAMRTMTVAARTFDSTISLRGHLVPGRVVEVVSPIESHVSRVHTNPGQQVAQGDVLVDLDDGRLTAEHRRAQIEYIKARDRLTEIEDWEDSTHVARARSAMRRARMGLDDAERNFERTGFMLERGIIPSSEHEMAERQLESRQMDFEEAEREMISVRSQGSDEERLVAQLEAQNAKDRLDVHAAKLEQTRIRAPISGVVLAAGEADAKPLARGRPLSQGELMLQIADFASVSVATWIDEADVQEVKVGQQAWITGPGFPDLQLDGSVTLVSSRASGGARRQNTPQFEVVVTLDRLPAEALERLRVGMSAHVTIVVYQQQEAVMVPIHAVERAAGEAYVRTIDPETEAVQRRTVTLGLTTLESVEVLEGLSFGETIVLPP